MLTRLVRTQLIIFTIASIVGMAVMVFGYMQLPTMLGLGKVVVTLELPASGGLYPLANVTYRGVQIGKVTAVVPTTRGADATLTLDKSPAVPADLRAEVRSISALGEQYVELLPRGTSSGYLRDGSVIRMQDTNIPAPVGPMLDQVSKLVDSIPRDKLGQLLDESFEAFNGAGYDLGSLIDSSTKLTGDLNGVADQARALVVDGGPLLDSQAQTADSIRTWAHSSAGVSDQLVANDPQLRSILRNGPAAAQEASKLLSQIKPTLPVLLANLTTVGQIAVTYNPSLEQILVLLPAYIAAQDSFALPQNNPTGWPLADFTITASDPPPCTAGFLPPSEWRSPAATSIIDTPDGLYCKLPQDSPISVRGARNYPCMGKPGKRAPTVEICDSDQPFEPLALREHTVGPYPIDPNLIAQGIPADGRVNPDRNIYGPLDGTPMPAPAPPGPATVAPSGYRGSDEDRPPLATARYDPATGRYLTADGQLVQQTNLAADGTAKTWKDLLPT